MKYIALIILIHAVTACQKQAESIDSHVPIQYEPTRVDHVISANITYDRHMPHESAAITAVPNNVAPWASSLFIIDERKQLLRGSLDTGAFKLIATNVNDMVPLARKNAAGVIMALTSDNTLRGYIETNDQGDYEEISFVKTLQNFNGFCKTETLKEQRIYGYDSHKPYTIDVINPSEKARIEALVIETLPAPTGKCLLTISDNDIDMVQTPKNILSASLLENNTLVFTTHESLERPRLFILKDGVTTAIDITGGLSTDAPSQIDSFTIIHDNLGGVLRNGAVLIADNASERVIYISLDLLNRRLSETIVSVPQE